MPLFSIAYFFSKKVLTRCGALRITTLTVRRNDNNNDEALAGRKKKKKQKSFFSC